jgi:hypothetical protein
LTSPLAKQRNVIELEYEYAVFQTTRIATRTLSYI